VKRNANRFPADFMFQLTAVEMEIWKSQIVMSNSEKMGIYQIYPIPPGVEISRDKIGYGIADFSVSGIAPLFRKCTEIEILYMC